MLGEDYPRLLGSLIQTLPQRIELPPGQEGFFQESGPCPSYDNEPRCGVRNRVRTRGLLTLESWYPALDRHPELMTIYTADFSKTGFGFVAPEQFFPGEVVRVFLATFWMRLTVRRCRRLGPNCYNCGGTLVDRHDPNEEALRCLAAECHA
tara:strand:+ start:541116 stop:541568 length:453 start_codon:yes stop_codon:yes gene_type:complete